MGASTVAFDMGRARVLNRMQLIRSCCSLASESAAQLASDHLERKLRVLNSVPSPIRVSASDAPRNRALLSETTEMRTTIIEAGRLADAGDSSNSDGKFPVVAVVIPCVLGILLLAVVLCVFWIIMRRHGWSHCGNFFQWFKKVKKAPDQQTKNMESITRGDLVLVESKSGSDSVILEPPGEHNLIAAESSAGSSRNLPDVELEELIGKGGFGVVYKGRYQGQTAAIKVIKHCQSQFRDSGWPLEMTFLQDMKHSNIVTMLYYATEVNDDLLASIPDSFQLGFHQPFRRNSATGSLERDQSIDETPSSEKSDSPVYRTIIVMEFCDKGALLSAIMDGKFLKIRGNRKVPKMVDILLCALDIARALEYLHSNGIIHGDLKAGNIFLKSSDSDQRGFICKVGDFGLSRYSTANAPLETQTLGTITHTPPEMLWNGVLTQSADVYAFGMLLWELMSGQLAYEHMEVHEIVFKVVGGGRPKVPSFFPNGYYDLINNCWRQSHLSRPRFHEVVQHLEDMLIEHSQLRNEKDVGSVQDSSSECL